MRQEYIQLVKTYLKRKPDYRNSIKQIRANAIALGATNEEFDEALKQTEKVRQQEQANLGSFTIPQVSYPTLPNQPKSTFGHMHFAAASVITGILFLVIGIYFISAINTKQSLVNPASKTKGAEQDTLTNSIAHPVYANNQVVDPEKAFSHTPANNISLAITGDPKKEVFGFFPYWMLGKEDQISLNALTSIAIFGLDVDGKGNIITTDSDGKPNPGWSMWNDPRLDDFLERVKQKRLNVQLTIKAFHNDDIEQLVVSDEAQKTFIANVLHLINVKGLRGINLDFEYVGDPDKTITEGFSRLVANLSTEMQRQIPQATLTLDTYISSATLPRLFDVEYLSNYVDAFIVMGYDIHTPLGSPGPISPMEGEMGILWFMGSYLEKVAPEKLILAVPYYAYDWVVPNVSENNGTIILPYAEIAELSKRQTILWDDVSQTPYYKYTDPETNLTHEVHYENTRSLGIKYDYVNRKNLKGIGIWALGYDGLNSDLRSLIIEKFAD